jgi:hypothetical protein
MTRIAGVSAREAGLFVKLAYFFTRRQIVELTHVIALENMRGRFNLALGIGAAGFSEGMVCAVPATTSSREGEDASS